MAAIIAALASLTHAYRYRFVRSEADLVRLLPRSRGSIFFVDVGVLRRAGILQLIEGSPAAQERGYRSFSNEAHFDFARDVDSFSGTFDGQTIFAALRGRFDWGALERYAGAHGGRCEAELCYSPASEPGRWVSFLPVQPDVMALAVSSDRSAARSLLPGRSARSELVPPEPVWVSLAPSLIRNPAHLPAAMRIFAISIQSAESVLLSLSGAGDGFKLQLDADFPSPTAADTARKQLETDTTLFTRELAREHEQPNPADLSGLLVRGTFEAHGKHLLGIWPVSMELLKALT